ncbi:MAG TPA: retropepsin-like aspartic protease [Candidatus Sulfotelmatobacter sp.]|nr:retropepsin-like aspartic protease [Candidatus Sulfotelmatobacter sp.]
MPFALLAAPALAVLLPVLAPARAPRYVRLRLDVVAYGVHGSGELLVDRATARFVRRFDAGPVSEREGWDGTHAWRADATGMARIEGNRAQRDAIRAFARAFARVLGGGTATRIVRHPGATTETTTLADRRIVDGLNVPFALDDVSVDGEWRASVRAVSVAPLADAAFAPPAPPHDVVLTGTTSVALDPSFDLPVVQVRVDEGPALRFLLDTGGQNVITPAAARRCGLVVVGEGTVDGVGPNVVPVRYAAARTVQIGTAVLRDQPFVVLDLGSALPVDGIVGYELLARLAARLDLAHHQLALARSAGAFGGGGARVPFVYDERQPQVEGALDGIAGAAGVDTGNDGPLEVYSHFVRAHDLVHRYHALPDDSSYVGVGGPVAGYLARARSLRIGGVSVDDVAVHLTTSLARGEESDPSVAMQIGDPVWKRFVVIFDYPRRLLRLIPSR